MATPEEIPIDEVLPPGVKSASDRLPVTEDDHEVARIMARWMDNLILIPGTKFRIGLDPILALFPGIGDFLASSAGLVVLLEGVRSRVSFFVLAHMGLNMLFNAVLNLIPGIGAVGSAVFKSNARNLNLLRRWQAGQTRQVRRGSLAVLLSLVLLLVAVVMVWMAIFFLYITFIKQLWTSLTGGG